MISHVKMLQGVTDELFSALGVEADMTVRGRLMLAVVAFLVATMHFGIAPASAHFSTCSSTYLKYEHNPIRYQISGGFSSNQLNATNSAISNWGGNSDVNFSSGSNDVWFGKSNQGTSGPEGYTENLINNSTCRIILSDVIMNSFRWDGYGYSEARLVVAHETGHVIGFYDIGGTANCSPLSIMLNAKSRMWNSMCTWSLPRSHDYGDVNIVY